MVSVITPAYNAASFLVDAVRSVLAQTSRNLELVIVDDGSTDDTVGIARGFAASDQRVRVVSTPNRGPAAARNTALRAARGEYIALLDSDDLLDRHYLERQIAVFRDRPDVSILTANAINRGGGPAFDRKPLWRKTTGVDAIPLLYLLEHEDAICILSIFRRHVYEQIGGFDEAFTGNEDYEFWLRAALAGFLIVRNYEPLGFYRRRDDSLSSDEPRMIGGLLRVLRHIEPHLDGHPLEREALRRQLTRFTAELQRAEFRAFLRRNDAAAAAHVLRRLAAERQSWVLGACARVTSYWPQPLVWAYRVRRGLRMA